MKIGTYLFFHMLTTFLKIDFIWRWVADFRNILLGQNNTEVSY